jgi:hypothetical protein
VVNSKATEHYDLEAVTYDRILWLWKRIYCHQAIPAKQNKSNKSFD